MWYYFRIGYATYLAIPVAFAGYVSAIYFLTVINIDILSQIFPLFSIFLGFTVFTLPILATTLGWLHFKRSPLFKAEQMIAIESNPYSAAVFKFYHNLARKLELVENAEEIGCLLKEMRVEGFN